MFSLLAPTCPPLTAPANGDIDCSLGDDGQPNPGDTCDFTCDDDFGAVGSSSRVCMNDESWSGTRPRCVQGVLDIVIIGVHILPNNTIRSVMNSAH